MFEVLLTYGYLLIYGFYILLISYGVFLAMDSLTRIAAKLSKKKTTNKRP